MTLIGSKILFREESSYPQGRFWFITFETPPENIGKVELIGSPPKKPGDLVLVLPCVSLRFGAEAPVIGQSSRFPVPAYVKSFSFPFAQYEDALHFAGLCGQAFGVEVSHFP